MSGPSGIGRTFQGDGSQRWAASSSTLSATVTRWSMFDPRCVSPGGVACVSADSVAAQEANPESANSTVKR